MNPLFGKTVVLDTQSSWVYVGTLKGEDERFFHLEQADAFDVSEVTLTKQEYLMKVKRDGLVVNRERTFVLKNIVTSITVLDDVEDS